MSLIPFLHPYSSWQAIGRVTGDLKTAVITPILKKCCLDFICNLAISLDPLQSLKRVVSNQFSKYLKSNNILNSFQSTYIPHKYTETILNRITSDILSNLNKDNGSILILLDMSVTFDTLHHSILAKRLSSIDIGDIAL